MDIFSEIEGLSGEELGSALLSYLIFNSHEIRDSFISFLSDHSPIGPISYVSHFSCRTEYPTTNKQYGDGRLDILIQLDDVVIGIENKFFAEFQQNQPLKYVESLEQVADSLKAINHTNVKAVLFISCPESRREKALEKIQGIDIASVITWENILQNFESLSELSNPVANIVLRQFIDYLKRHFSFIHEFEKKSIHLRNIFPDYGSPLQTELVGKLWSLFPSAGGRLSNGKTWLGYYFFTDPDINEKGWYGFVPKEELTIETENEAELIIATTYKPDFNKNFKEIKIKEENFIGSPGNTNTYVIEYDISWNSLDKWRENLFPLWAAVPKNIT